MHVPCPVPLQDPWSPVGYNVVEVPESKAPGEVPVVRVLPQGAKAEGQGTAPSSPMGYRVVVVAEKPATPRPEPVEFLRRLSPRRSLWKDKEVIIWGSVGLGAACILGLTLVLAINRASEEVPVKGPLNGIFAGRQPPQVQIPEADGVKLPKEFAAEKPAFAVKDNPAPVVAAPGEALPAADAPGCANGACKVDGAPMPERAHFGTAVAFVRNPQEAARAAARDSKLTFILHVSGNFEEARFT